MTTITFFKQNNLPFFIFLLIFFAQTPENAYTQTTVLPWDEQKQMFGME